MWGTYRKGFSASTSDLPEDLQQVADAIAASAMPASIAVAGGSAFGETWMPIPGWAQES
ncbi:hypothetical protein MX659_07630 [Coriobacteriia bacterium Es71-Z0120]|uniref:hypothetical protein n=1 Tax=Parvivirga hydrogeniphila TaxID=2939460 RepID=UPI002260B993|nr:hypothetical protein [Parvivirga hydrogeniphila]MCL4079452.1 hypothetical protein [Parvivirga hydrogeniphila]